MKTFADTNRHGSGSSLVSGCSRKSASCRRQRRENAERDTCYIKCSIFHPAQREPEPAEVRSGGNCQLLFNNVFSLLRRVVEHCINTSFTNHCELWYMCIPFGDVRRLKCIWHIRQHSPKNKGSILKSTAYILNKVFSGLTFLWHLLLHFLIWKGKVMIHVWTQPYLAKPNLSFISVNLSHTPFKI